MMKSRWMSAGLLLLAGCLSKVDREAISFPDMPGMPIYRATDNRQLSPDQATDALLTAERACSAPSSGAVSSPVGSSAFDSCMTEQGYQRVR